MRGIGYADRCEGAPVIGQVQLKLRITNNDMRDTHINNVLSRWNTVIPATDGEHHVGQILDGTVNRVHVLREVVFGTGDLLKKGIEYVLREYYPCSAGVGGC